LRIATKADDDAALSTCQLCRKIFHTHIHHFPTLPTVAPAASEAMIAWPNGNPPAH